MASEVLEVALFVTGKEGTVRMLGRSTECGLVQLVRERIAAEQRSQLAEIEPPVRLVPSRDISE